MGVSTSKIIFAPHLAETRAVLLQGEPRDAAVNFDYRTLQRHSAVSLPNHSFFVYISDRSNTEITHKLHNTLIFGALTQNYSDSRKSRHAL